MQGAHHWHFSTAWLANTQLWRRGAQAGVVAEEPNRDSTPRTPRRPRTGAGRLEVAQDDFFEHAGCLVDASLVLEEVGPVCEEALAVTRSRPD
jgi:hypothetical protein